ncbi:MAG: hypothetical protein AAF078_13350, partial [Planctomycetota bacterium]
MTDDQSEQLRHEAHTSLARLQSLDAEVLARRAELGESLNLDAAVEPARRLVQLYKQFPLDALSWFPASELKVLKQQADAD